MVCFDHPPVTILLMILGLGLDFLTIWSICNELHTEDKENQRTIPLTPTSWSWLASV